MVLGDGRGDNLSDFAASRLQTTLANHCSDYKNDKISPSVKDLDSCDGQHFIEDLIRKKLSEISTTTTGNRSRNSENSTTSKSRGECDPSTLGLINTVVDKVFSVSQ